MSSAFNEESNFTVAGKCTKAVDLIQRQMSIINELQEDLQLADNRSLKFREFSNKLWVRLINDEKQIDSSLAHLNDIQKSIKELNLSIKKFSSLKEKYSKIEVAKPVDNFSSEFEKSKRNQLLESVMHYEGLFGLKIQRTHSGLLQLLFQGCTQNGTCYCQLRFVGGNHLELQECHPAVPDIDRLINHLNWTEDLCSFVITLRRRFCRYFEKKSKM